MWTATLDSRKKAGARLSNSIGWSRYQCNSFRFGTHDVLILFHFETVAQWQVSRQVNVSIY